MLGPSRDTEIVIQYLIQYRTCEWIRLPNVGSDGQKSFTEPLQTKSSYAFIGVLFAIHSQISAQLGQTWRVLLLHLSSGIPIKQIVSWVSCLRFFKARFCKIARTNYRYFWKNMMTHPMRDSCRLVVSVGSPFWCLNLRQLCIRLRSQIHL